MSQPLGQPQGNQQQGTGQAPPPQGAPQNGPPPPVNQPPNNQGNGQQAGQQSQGQGQAPQPQDVASLPDWAQRELASARADASRARNEAKATAAQEATAEVTKRLAAALGITPEGQAPDPATLQAQIVERETQLKIERIENAAYRAATRLGANPEMLLNWSPFLASARQLDPSAADFATQLDAVVTGTVTGNPFLQAAQQPGAAPPPFAPNPAQQAGNGAPPPPPTTVSAGAERYRQKHAKT